MGMAKGGKVKKIIIGGLVTAYISMAGVAWGIVFGDSNLGIFGYPDNECHEPTKPYSNDEYLWRSFQADVELYDQCIRKYLEAAENDRKRVIEKADEAVQKYNRFVRSL